MIAKLVLFSATLVTAIGLSDNGIATACKESLPTIRIHFDNGAPPVKEGAAVPKMGDSFHLAPGESFSVGAGTSYFSFKDFPQGVEQVELVLDINPGDSFLNLSLPGGFHITARHPQSAIAWVREGDGLSIAYGFDERKQRSARVTLTYQGIKTNSQRSH